MDQEVEPPPPPPISAEKAEQLSLLEEKIKNLLEQVESLGEAGKVDEAEALMRKVLQIMLAILFDKCALLTSCIVFPNHVYPPSLSYTLLYTFFDIFSKPTSNFPWELNISGGYS